MNEAGPGKHVPVSYKKVTCDQVWAPIYIYVINFAETINTVDKYSLSVTQVSKIFSPNQVTILYYSNSNHMLFKKNKDR